MPSRQHQQEQRAQDRERGHAQEDRAQHPDDDVREPHHADHEVPPQLLRRRWPRARGRPRRTAELTVSKVYPRRCSSTISRSSAATVWDRSPPPSWNMTTAPRSWAGRPAATMRPTPGLAQSLGVEVGEHRPVAARVHEGAPVGGREGVHLRGVGHPHQVRRTARRCRDGQLGLVQLDATSPRGDVGQVHVRERVHPDLVPGVAHAPQHVGSVGHPGPDDEERRRDVAALEDVEDLGGPSGRAVVEGQHHVPGGDVETRPTRVRRVDDRPAVQDRGGHPPRPGGRPRARAPPRRSDRW